MTTDEARSYLKKKFKPEYAEYIDHRLAGDFAVKVAEKILRLSIENIANTHENNQRGA